MILESKKPAAHCIRLCPRVSTQRNDRWESTNNESEGLLLKLTFGVGRRDNEFVMLPAEDVVATLDG